MSAPGLALLLTMIHSPFPCSLCLGIKAVFSFQEKIYVNNLCATMKFTTGQLASCQPFRWTLMLFSVDSKNLSGCGTYASRHGSAGFK